MARTIQTASSARRMKRPTVSTTPASTTPASTTQPLPLSTLTSPSERDPLQMRLRSHAETAFLELETSGKSKITKSTTSKAQLPSPPSRPFVSALRPGSPCVFWTLPAELRNEIYALAYVEDKPIPVDTWPMTNEHHFINKLLVYRAYYHEAMPVFCGSNLLTFASLADLCELADGIMGQVGPSSDGVGYQLSENVRKNISRIAYDTLSEDCAVQDLYVHYACIVNGLPNLQEIRLIMDSESVFEKYCDYEYGSALSAENFKKIGGVKKMRDRKHSVRIDIDDTDYYEYAFMARKKEVEIEEAKQHKANVQALVRYLNGEEI